MISLLLLWACTADKSPADTGQAPDGGVTDGGGTDTGTTTPDPMDHDGDGWTSDQDCDDIDPAVNPGAVEICNGADDDCDGLLDDADPDVADPYRFHADVDGDSFGDPLLSAVACAAPTGFVDNASDCLDSDPTIHPEADEVCDDGLDNDCDGTPNDCLLEGTWDLSELATTVWRADDDDCLAAVERGEFSECYAIGMSMVSSSLGGQDLDGDGRPDLLVRSPSGSENLIIPLDATTETLKQSASAELSYAGIPISGKDCEPASLCKQFTRSGTVGDWDGDGFQDLGIASADNYTPTGPDRSS